MANLSADELRSAISDIMKDADLTTLSSKKIRNICENKFDVDLTSRKQEVDEIVMSFVQSNADNDASEEENNVPSNSEGSKSSESGEEDEKPPPKTKKVISKKPKEKHSVKKEKKEKSDRELLDDHSDDSSETDDAAVARKLQEEEWNFRRRAAKKMPRERSKKTKNSDDTKPKVRKGSTYTRKCTLSAELAEVMETNEMARPDVVKKMWAIVRERELLDPSNKQFAICDEQLKKVFGKKRVRMFGMMKYLKNHMKDIK